MKLSILLAHKKISIHLDNLLTMADIDSKTIIALQPISQKPRATQLCIDTCVARNWRLSVQTHKYLSIA